MSCVGSMPWAVRIYGWCALARVDFLGELERAQGISGSCVRPRAASSIRAVGATSSPRQQGAMTQGPNKVRHRISSHIQRESPMGTPMKAAMLVALTAYGAAVPVTPEHTLQPGLTDSSNATSGSVVDRSSTATATTAAATTVAAASYQGTCPPQGWERCGNQWPPLFNYYCCATSGYMGTSPLHCDKDQGGINALEHCCERFEPHGDVPGYLSCKSECEPPPADCTGDPAIDKILLEADVGCKIGLTKMNAVYTWQGFCDAVKYFNDLGDRTLYLGQNEADGLQTGAGLSNIAALLAQCMWESGGEAPFTACDENNYRQTENAACTQRADGARYDSLNDEPWACDVDPNMHMVAETFASWAQLGPMTCKPNSVTEGCVFRIHSNPRPLDRR